MVTVALPNKRRCHGEISPREAQISIPSPPLILVAVDPGPNDPEVASRLSCSSPGRLFHTSQSLAEPSRTYYDRSVASSPVFFAFANQPRSEDAVVDVLVKVFPCAGWVAFQCLWDQISWDSTSEVQIRKNHHRSLVLYGT